MVASERREKRDDWQQQAAMQDEVGEAHQVATPEVGMEMLWEMKVVPVVVQGSGQQLLVACRACPEVEAAQMAEAELHSQEEVAQPLI